MAVRNSTSAELSAEPGTAAVSTRSLVGICNIVPVAVNDVSRVDKLAHNRRSNRKWRIGRAIIWTCNKSPVSDPTLEKPRKLANRSPAKPPAKKSLVALPGAPPPVPKVEASVEANKRSVCTNVSRGKSSRKVARKSRKDNTVSPNNGASTPINYTAQKRTRWTNTV